MILKAIKKLLHDDGLTIKGVQKLHKEQGLTALAIHGGGEAAVSFSSPEAVPTTSQQSRLTDAGSGSAALRLQAVLADLETARARLDAVLAA